MNIKINWGTAIFLSFIAFGCFIGYLVYSIQTDNYFEHHMVDEDYYELERNVSSELKAKMNGFRFKKALILDRDDSALRFKFYGIVPDESRVEVTGYRPNNPQQDFYISIAPVNEEIVIPQYYLIDGRWKIKFQWRQSDSLFIVDKEFIY